MLAVDLCLILNQACAQFLKLVLSGKSVCVFVCVCLPTGYYHNLPVNIATAPITFSKRKIVATKRGWPLNICRVPSSGVYMVLIIMFQM